MAEREPYGVTSDTEEQNDEEDSNFHDAASNINDAPQEDMSVEADGDTPYLTLTARNPGRPTPNSGRLARAGKYIKYMVGLSSLRLEEILADYRIEMRKHSTHESVFITWVPPPNTMFVFELSQREKSGANPQRQNTRSNEVEFEKLEFGREYQLHVTSECKGSKKECSFKFTTCPQSPTNIKVENGLLKWDAVRGAKNLKVRFSKDGGLEDLDGSKCSVKFPDFNYRIGDQVQVEILAFGDEQIKQNNTIKTVIVGGDNVPRNLKARSDQKDPYRRINLEWSEPCNTNCLLHYLVKIKRVDKTVKEYTTTNRMHTFSELMSHALYQCSVQAVYSSNIKSAEAVTEAKTAFKQRNPVEVSTIGRAIDVESKLDYGDEIKCMMWWKLPDLGVYSEDYKRMDVVVNIFRNKGKVKKYISADETSVSFPLEWGAKFTSIVTITYQDLDSLQNDQAKTSHEIVTKLEAVAQESIKHEEEENCIKISWSPARGASAYELNVLDESNDVVYKSPGWQPRTDHSIKMENSSDMCWGRTYIFKVIAYNEDRDSENVEKQVFIGRHAPKNAKLSNDRSDPHRTLSLTWEKPFDSKSHTFVCTLYDTNGKEVATKDAFGEKEKFTQLKQGVVYYADIGVKIKGKALWSTRSNRIKTKDGLKYRGNIESEGVITCFKDKEMQNNGSKMSTTFKISWNKPILTSLREHFALQHMEFRMRREHDNTSVTKDVTKNLDDALEETVTVHRGVDYLVQIVAVFSNLDSDDHKESSFTKTLQTDLSTPTTTVQFVDEKMSIHCEKISVPSSFEFKIMDMAGGVLVSKSSKSNVCDFLIQQKLEYGKECRVCVVVTPPNGRRETSTCETVIGGPKVPYNVDACANPSNTRRSIFVRWNAPTNGASKYGIKLLYWATKQVVRKEETNKTEITFHELKSSTSYFALVSVIDDNGKHSREAGSAQVTTTRVDSPYHDAKFHSRIWHKVPIRQTEQASICWEGLKLDDVYKIEGYQVKLWTTGWKVWEWKKYSKNVDVHESGKEYKVAFDGLKKNTKYDVTVEAQVKNLDTEEKTPVTGHYSFYVALEKPALNGISYNSTGATFEWNPIEGGLFDLEVVEENTSAKILSRTGMEGSNANIPFDKDFRVGRSCRLTLSVYLGNSKNREEHTEQFVIGGDDVPRNLALSNNPSMPHRRMNISFDHPISKIRPSIYRISAQTTQDCDTITTTSTLISFKNLRSNTEYTFSVEAVYEGEITSRASTSEAKWTKPCDSVTMRPAIDLKNMSHSTLNLSKIQSNTFVTKELGENFDIVSDLKIECLKEGNGWEEIAVHWCPPLFNNFSDNFRMIRYKVTVKGDPKEIVKDYPSKEGDAHYRSDEFRLLTLGTKYTIVVSSTYNDIDGRRKNCQSNPLKSCYETRPGKPTITKNFCDERQEKIVLEWLSANGAQEYQVDIFTTDMPGNNRTISDITHGTTWSHDFTDDCRFGNTYYVQVTAKSAGSKKNFDTTSPKIIGGNRVPKKAQADRDVDCPTTAAVVKWEPPVDESLVEKYEIETVRENDTTSTHAACFEKTRGKVVDLNPGTEYKFKVYAVCNGVRSGGCETNKITTNPGPGKVKILKPMLNKHDYSTKVDVFWEKEDDFTFYKVKISSLDEDRSFVQIVKTRKESCTISSLQPGTQYRISVTGGNEDGLGNESEFEEIVTELGRPRDIHLSTSQENPCTKMMLKFHPASGNVSGYRAVIYKSANKVSERLLPVTEHKAEFEGLSPHTEYYITVEAKYEQTRHGTGYGQPVRSNPAWTAPGKPYSIAGYLSVSKEDNVSRNVLQINWDQLSGCTFHEIEVCQTGQPVENTLKIPHSEQEEKQTCYYNCLEKACQYQFRVRSANSSGFYGIWSEKYPVTLAPKKPHGLKVELQENGQVKLTWSRPETQVKYYRIDVYCNDEVQKEGDEIDFSTEYTLSNTVAAAKYYFLLSAIGDSHQISEKAKSNTICSRPGKCELQTVKTVSSNTIEVTWKSYFEDCYFELGIWKSEDMQKNQVTGLADHVLRVEGVKKGENKEEDRENLYHLQVSLELGRHIVKIRAVYEVAVGVWSKPKSASTFPGKVRNLSLKLVENRLKVSWKQAKSKPLRYKASIFVLDVMSGYRKEFYRAKLLDVDALPQSDVVSFFEDINWPGRTYICEAFAINGCGEGEVSVSSGLFIPHSTTDISFVRDEYNPSQKIRLMWKEMVGVDCFKLTLSSETSSKREVLLNECEYDFNDGIPGTTYDACLFWGAGGQFFEQFCARKFTLVPAKVRELKITEDESGTFILRWEPTIPQPQQYIVQWRYNERDASMKEEVTSNILEINAALGDQVVAQVAACNDAGQGEFSDECEGTRRPPPPKSVLVRHGIRNPESSIIVKIEDIYDYRKTYEIAVKNISSGKVIATVSSQREILIGGLHPGDVYEISSKTIIRSVVSECISCLEPIQTYPHPIKVKCKQDKSGLHFEWESPCDDVEKYCLEWKIDDGETFKRSTEICKFLLRVPLPGRQYNVRVAARNMGGLGRKGDWTRIVTHPGKIQSISAETVEEVEATVTFQWDRPDYVIEKFSVECKENYGEIRRFETTRPEYKTDHAKPSHTYQIRVKAMNASGAGEWSNWKAFDCVPDRVSNISFKSTTNSISLSWNPPSPNAPGRYLVTSADGQTSETIKCLFTANNLQPGRTYRFRIAAQNDTGLGEMSDWFEAHTEPAPPKILKIEEQSPLDSKDTTLVISLDDETDENKHYIVTISSRGKVITTAHSKEKTVEIKGLRSSTKYGVAAQTRFHGLLSKFGH